MLEHRSGALTYVNAGHNPPIVSTRSATTSLEATGMPLGLFDGAAYEARTGSIPSGGALLLFTDGLPDSIEGDDPEARLRAAMSGGSATTMSDVTSIINRGLTEDDVTVVLVKRLQSSTT